MCGLCNILATKSDLDLDLKCKKSVPEHTVCCALIAHIVKHISQKSIANRGLSLVTQIIPKQLVQSV